MVCCCESGVLLSSPTEGSKNVHITTSHNAVWLVGPDVALNTVLVAAPSIFCRRACQIACPISAEFSLPPITRSVPRPVNPKPPAHILDPPQLFILPVLILLSDPVLISSQRLPVPFHRLVVSLHFRQNLGQI